MIFSQNELCDTSIEFSNLYYNNDYETLLLKLETLKSNENNDSLNPILDFNLARLYFYLKKYNVAEELLLNLNTSDEAFHFNRFICDKSVFVDEYEVENIFNNLSGNQLKQKTQLLLSDIYYEKQEYNKSLQYLKDSQKNENCKLISYGCGNAMIVDILQYEHRKFVILNKLGEIEQANQSGLSILFLTQNENLIKELRANLLQQYSKKEIIKELKAQLKEIKRGDVLVCENIINTTYIDFFSYKVLFWKSDEKLTKSKSYEILTSEF